MCMKIVDEIPKGSTGVYCIRNLFDEKCYIGSSSESLRTRLNRHLRELKRGRHGNFRLRRAWEHCGADAFEVTILEFCRPAYCLCAEQRWLDSLKPAYNINPSAWSPLGRKQTSESIEKTRLAHLGSKRTPEAKAKMRLAALGHKRCVGRKYSPETIERIRQGNLRRNWKRVGWWHTEEAKMKMAAAKLGRKASEETRLKMRESRRKYLLTKSK